LEKSRKIKFDSFVLLRDAREMTRRIIVGISGSSAPIYGIRLLEVLSRNPSIETHLVLTEGAETTLALEAPGWTRRKVESLAVHVHDPNNLAASISSGSFITAGMVVIPCSMKTLGNIAHSTGGDLLSRAADVILKERRRLILVPRETPLHLGHLRNMVTVTELGGIIMPPIPAFYHKPKTIEDLIQHTIGRVLDLLEIEHQLFQRWKTPEKSKKV
jgi:flavin prenyltransferase